MGKWEQNKLQSIPIKKGIKNSDKKIGREKAQLNQWRLYFI